MFLEDAEVPIDNNAQERLLRSHVVGRKTWYGTHSERGAKTAAILFSLVESCKLNQVNPREYFEQLTKDLLQGKKAYTPDDFKKLSIPGPEGPV
ncbi:MAG: transposase [Deltaproteobacteria bacterium]|nr:transposase [Deltaproteobacteria bacterium]